MSNTTNPITEADISTLVDTFYTRVRLDPEIGPIFNAAVESWPAHLALLKDFWSTVLLTSGRYKGNPLLAHFPLAIEPRHFTRWLSLFTQTATEVLTPTHAALVTHKANNVAANMQRVITSTSA